jgi:hypothetical protein
MAKSNTSSVKMDSGLKLVYMANALQKKEQGYGSQQQSDKGEVNASKSPKSAAQKAKAKAKAKMAKQSRKKNK